MSAKTNEATERLVQQTIDELVEDERQSQNCPCDGERKGDEACHFGFPVAMQKVCLP